MIILKLFQELPLIVHLRQFSELNTLKGSIRNKRQSAGAVLPRLNYSDKSRRLFLIKPHVVLMWQAFQ